MKKYLFFIQFIIYILVFAVFIVGCSDVIEAEPEADADDIVEPKELFSFQNTKDDAPTSKTDNDETNDEANDEYSDIFDAFDPIAEPINPMRKYLADGEEYPPPPFDVDIDLTIYDAHEFDIVFSDVMFMETEEHLGKSIRIVGPYGNVSFDGEEYFHFMLVDDSAGCCQRAIDLEWAAANRPEEYPKQDSILDIVGVFTAEERIFTGNDGLEYEYTYYYILILSMIILQEGESE